MNNKDIFYFGVGVAEGLLGGKMLWEIVNSDFFLSGGAGFVIGTIGMLLMLGVVGDGLTRIGTVGKNSLVQALRITVTNRD